MVRPNRLEKGGMMAKRFRWGKRRTLSTSVTVIALLALAVGVTQGIAGSGDGQTAPVQHNNANCGFDAGKRVHRDGEGHAHLGGTLTVKVQLSGADAGSYHLDLYGKECTFLETIGKFKVDASGSGSKVSATCCYSSGEYFVDARNTDTDTANDSLIVSL